MARPRVKKGIGFVPGDLVHANGRGFGIVVSSLKIISEDGVDTAPWEWHVIINNRLIRTSSLSAFTLVQSDT